ncbi:MAG TPA: hypothetical protein VEI97_07555, partial [bacterium]|nr:hypothetical protein [bacterium]
MRNFAWWLASGAAALALGCTGSSEAPTAPAGTAAPTGGSAALGAALVRDDLAMAASAIYRLEVDPSTLAATVSLKDSRAGQKNDDIYDLSVDAFMGPGNIAVQEVTSDGTNLTFNVLVTHPFKAPTNLDGPATAANRADLGVAMRLLFMLDAEAAGNTYFSATDNVVVNTAMLVNQDGYFSPKGMVTTAGLTATAFPFKNVVDEIADNRVAADTLVPISNGGSATGNFDTNDGWTRATMGPGNIAVQEVTSDG